ncbi:MAG: hypothetical protein F6J97_00660 [Leptolyngbya sp. SIO4C1]|nr:hypothetical protein [Leptolyngbya sp. SIO4C1]
MTQQPKIVRLNLLDTDYAAIVAGEPIPEDRKCRLEAADARTFKYISKQIARYRYDNLDQEGRDDVLCNIGMTAELLTPADLEDIHERQRTAGYFYLTEAEREQILNWLKDELSIDLGTGAG